MNTKQIQQTLVFINDIATHIMGKPFDHRFRRFINMDRLPSPMWRSEISIHDRSRAMTLEKMQQMAYHSSVRFSAVILEDDLEICNGCDLTNPKACGEYTFTDVEDVAYEGDDVGNAQCSISNILSDPIFGEMVHWINFTKIVHERIYISMSYYDKRWILEFANKCSEWIPLAKQIIERNGFTILPAEESVDPDDDAVYLYFH